MFGEYVGNLLDQTLFYYMRIVLQSNIVYYKISWYIKFTL